MLKKFLITTIAASTLALGTMTFADNHMGSSNASNQFSPDQVQQIQKIVHDYLVNNPKVLLEASRSLQQQQMAKMQKDAVSAIQQNLDNLFNDKDTPTIGAQNAPVQVVEFFDYQCGHCKAMANIIEKIVKQDSNIQIIFKELPIFGADSTFAAKAALASASQGKYYEFHNALLAADDPITKDKVFQVAKKIGLDVDKLKQDMQNPVYGNQIKANFKLAEALKLQGTPAFVISNKEHTKFKFIPGATSQSQMQAAINSVK